jgi:hypothetical protein
VFVASSVVDIGLMKVNRVGELGTNDTSFPVTLRTGCRCHAIQMSHRKRSTRNKKKAIVAATTIAQSSRVPPRKKRPN